MWKSQEKVNHIEFGWGRWGSQESCGKMRARDNIGVIWWSGGQPWRFAHGLLRQLYKGQCSLCRSLKSANLLVMVIMKLAIWWSEYLYLLFSSPEVRGVILFVTFSDEFLWLQDYGLLREIRSGAYCCHFICVFVMKRKRWIRRWGWGGFLFRKKNRFADQIRVSLVEQSIDVWSHLWKAGLPTLIVNHVC